MFVYYFSVAKEESAAFNNETVAASMMFWSPPSIILPFIAPVGACANICADIKGRMKTRKIDLYIPEIFNCFKILFCKQQS